MIYKGVETRVSLGRLLAAVFIAIAATPVWAVPITFFGEDLNASGSGRIALAGSNSQAARNAFLANLTGVGTDDFESYTDGAGAPLALTFPGSVGTITATISGQGNIDNVSSGTSAAGRWPTSGNQYWTTNSTTSGFSIAFDSAVSAFGFYGTDIGDVTGQLTLVLTAADTTTSTVVVPNTTGASNASLLFFGLIDPVTSFTNISFSSSNQDDFFGVDDLTVGDSEQVSLVPAPASILLLGLGLVILGRIRRAV